MFNNLCLPERAAELVQLALIESRAERRLKHILTAQLLALKERALGRGAPRRVPTNSPACSQYGQGGGCLRIPSHAKHTLARTDISSGGFYSDRQEKRSTKADRRVEKENGMENLKH